MTGVELERGRESVDSLLTGVELEREGLLVRKKKIICGPLIDRSRAGERRSTG